MKNTMYSLWIDLKELDFTEPYTAKESYQQVHRFVYEVKSDLLDAWANAEHEEFEKALRILEQKTAQIRHCLNMNDVIVQSSILVGMLQGFTELFGELLRKERQDQRIIAMCASQSAATDRILMQLYEANDGQGMRHGELADALGYSYSNLTNAMKRILNSGAVEAARTGKNTYYMLTPAGQRYCVQKQKTRYTPSQDEIKKAVVKAIDFLYSPAEGQRASIFSEIRSGDKFKLAMQGQISCELKAGDILGFPDCKYLNCEELPPSSSALLSGKSALESHFENEEIPAYMINSVAEAFR